MFFWTYLRDSIADMNIFNMPVFIKINPSDDSGLQPIPYFYLEKSACQHAQDEDRNEVCLQ